MTHGVTFLSSLLCWEIILNDLNHQTIDLQRVLTTLLGANEQPIGLLSERYRVNFHQ